MGLAELSGPGEQRRMAISASNRPVEVVDYPSQAPSRHNSDKLAQSQKDDRGYGTNWFANGQTRCFAVGSTDLYAMIWRTLRRVNHDDYSVAAERKLEAGETFRSIALAPGGPLFAMVGVADPPAEEPSGLRRDDDSRVIHVLDPLTLATTTTKAQQFAGGYGASGPLLAVVGDELFVAGQSKLGADEEEQMGCINVFSTGPAAELVREIRGEWRQAKDMVAMDGRLYLLEDNEGVYPRHSPEVAAKKAAAGMKIFVISTEGVTLEVLDLKSQPSAERPYLPPRETTGEKDSWGVSCIEPFDGKLVVCIHRKRAFGARPGDLKMVWLEHTGE